jgi:gentisate 1,2-dioxygenase
MDRHRAAGPSPLLNYTGERTTEARRQLAISGASLCDDVALEHINPHTGGPVLPTVACWLQIIRSGVYSKPHRQTNSVVYHVLRGEGGTGIAALGFYREQPSETHDSHQPIMRECRP